MKELISQHKNGFTMSEVVIAILVLGILSLGAFSFQLHSVRQTKQAGAKMCAARIGSFILENWKSAAGSNTYDPTIYNVGISKIDTTLYQMTMDDIPFYFRLFHQDIDSNDTTGVTLRELRVIVQWNAEYQLTVPTGSDPISAYYTYVRRDQSGG